MTTAGDARVRVLIVDDEPAVLDGFRRALRPIARSWDVLFAQDGGEALMTAKLEPVDVLVTDIRMPNMHGVALLKRFAERYPDVLRVAFSDKFDALTIYSLTDCSHVYIPKPCTAEDLHAFVKRHFAEHTHRLAAARDAAERPAAETLKFR